MTFLSVIPNELVTFYLQNVTATVPLKPTYFQKLIFKTCWSELYLAIGLSTPLLHRKNFILSSANRVPHFLLSTLNRVSTVAFTVSVLWRFFCEKYHKSRVEKYFAGFLSWHFEEGGIGIFGFAVLDIFWIGFSVFVSKDVGFSVLVFNAVCGFFVF